MTKKSKIDHYTDKEALDFHNKGKSGKIEIISSKSLTTKRDLSLAYSPGVAIPVKEISKNPDAAYEYTSKGNLVAVIRNGSAILGLGNLGSKILNTPSHARRAGGVSSAVQAARHSARTKPLLQISIITMMDRESPADMQLK